MNVPPVLLDLLRMSLQGDWWGNLRLGLGAVLVLSLVVFVGAVAKGTR